MNAPMTPPMTTMMTETTTQSLEQIWKQEEDLSQCLKAFGPGWNLQIFQSEECQSYLAWNHQTWEGLMIDPKANDLDAYLKWIKTLPELLWLGVIDTHTHADHISVGSELAKTLNTSYVMSHLSPSRRVQLRVCSDQACIASRAAPIRFLHTPGHTQDSLIVFWGPFLFGGDTVLFGDVGRDDLPEGNAESHFESLQKIKKRATQEQIFLPGHDCKGGQASSWKMQLSLNPSLTQNQEDFVREAQAFHAPAPKFFKESLRENFR
jgi:sulfur dioxygenase